MSDNIVITLLPLLAMLLAAVSVAALWYWRSSSPEDAGENPTLETPIQELPSEEPTVGDLIGKVTTSAQSWLSGVTKTNSVPTSGMASTSGYVPASGTTPISDGEVVEVLRVFRDLADGGLVVDIGGRRYRNAAEITDPQVKRRFVGNAQALAQFVQVEASLSSPMSQSIPPAEVTGPPPAPAWTAQPVVPIITPKPDTPGQPEGPKTIADEIEELIQFRLLSMPSLSNRSIHIRSGLGGGVQVEIDGVYFDSVSNVTDPEILAFLQSVIREWEARS